MKLYVYRTVTSSSRNQKKNHLLVFDQYGNRMTVFFKSVSTRNFKSDIQRNKMKIDVVFYMSGFEKRQALFEQKVISSIPRNSRKICKSLDELSSVLRRSMVGQYICVVVAGKKQDLLDLFSVQELLKNSKLILIMPDNSNDIIEIGHAFYPRFLDSINGNYLNIAAVLKKMAHIGPAEAALETKPDIH